ncbi:MAG: ABC transporter ATP-binding protein [Synergistaceae bacterium]|nr:ABC transporter ATP-binding protein [Synergistaceae bacterium]
MLAIDNLVVSYGKIDALHDMSISLEPGALTTLIGANGAGKTTLLKTISGLMKPKSGTITYEGTSLIGLEPHEIIALGIAHCPEGRRVLARQTVYENMKMGAYVRNDDEVGEDIEYFFKKFPQLEGRRHHLSGFLSGGEQQMLAICRALMSRPKILLLDEPSMGLSPVLVKEVFKIIKDIHDEGVTILLVEQNAKMALSIADKGYVLEVGRIIAEDTAANLMNSKSIQDSYLGG